MRLLEYMQDYSNARINIAISKIESIKISDDPYNIEIIMDSGTRHNFHSDAPDKLIKIILGDILL